MLTPIADIAICFLSSSAHVRGNLAQHSIIDDIVHGNFSRNAGLFFSLVEKILQRLAAYRSVFTQSLQHHLISFIRDLRLQLEFARDKLSKFFSLLSHGSKR